MLFRLLTDILLQKRNDLSAQNECRVKTIERHMINIQDVAFEISPDFFYLNTRKVIFKIILIESFVT